MELEEYRSNKKVAQDLAGKAILLEIGARLMLINPLLMEERTYVPEVAVRSNVVPSFVESYYQAMVHSKMVDKDRDVQGKAYYVASSSLRESINEAGYLLWGLMSCAPLISNAASFSHNPELSAGVHPRDGEHVARTSRWMGEKDFYPQAERAIISLQPKKIVDLGAGTCGLLIRCLKRLPQAHGIGVDINGDACEKAKLLLRESDLSQRTSVIEASIQSLVKDPSCIESADVIHAGFVFHDLMPDAEEFLDELLKTCREKAPRGALIVVDAIPYSQKDSEQSFSAAFTFLHNQFMCRQLLTEEEWITKLAKAGYKNVEVEALGISGGRIFIARA